MAIITGGTGDDQIVGSIYNDYIDGGIGNDYIESDSGNDTLIGGSGGDTLIGGFGSDIFKYNALSDSLFIGNLITRDTIIDYSKRDQLDAPANVLGTTIYQSWGDIDGLSSVSITSFLNSSRFPANRAVAFTDTLFYNGTFVAFNDGTAGFNYATDSLIFLQGYNVSSSNPIVVI